MLLYSLAREDMSLKQSQFDPKFPDAGGLKVCTVPSLISRLSGNEIMLHSNWPHSQTAWNETSTYSKTLHVNSHCLQFSLRCFKYDRHGYKARQRVFLVTEKVG